MAASLGIEIEPGGPKRGEVRRPAHLDHGAGRDVHEVDRQKQVLTRRVQHRLVALQPRVDHAQRLDGGFHRRHEAGSRRALATRSRPTWPCSHKPVERLALEAPGRPGPRPAANAACVWSQLTARIVEPSVGEQRNRDSRVTTEQHRSRDRRGSIPLAHLVDDRSRAPRRAGRSNGRVSCTVASLSRLVTATPIRVSPWRRIIGVASVSNPGRS